MLGFSYIKGQSRPGAQGFTQGHEAGDELFFREYGICRVAAADVVGKAAASGRSECPPKLRVLRERGKCVIE